MFDRRNLTSDGVGAPIHKFEGHKAAVLCVQVLTVQHVMFFLISCTFYEVHLLLELLVFITFIFSSGLQTNLLSLGVLLKMAS